MFGLTTLSLLVAQGDARQIGTVCALGHDANRNHSGKTFTLPEYANSLTLRHESGSISCGPNHNINCVDGPWGSYRINGSLHAKIILVDSRGSEKTGDLDRRQKIMTFRYLAAGEYSVWYEEDYKESQHTDNTGKSCFEVSYSPPKRRSTSTSAPKKRSTRKRNSDSSLDDFT